MKKSPITTHVLDTAGGTPGRGIEVVLERMEDGAWMKVANGVTNDDGRISDWMEGQATPGMYRATFRVASFYERHAQAPFYSDIPIVFHLHDPESHYHIPLLLSPFGYTTYRGS